MREFEAGLVALIPVSESNAAAFQLMIMGLYVSGRVRTTKTSTPLETHSVIHSVQRQSRPL